MKAFRNGIALNAHELTLYEEKIQEAVLGTTASKRAMRATYINP